MLVPQTTMLRESPGQRAIAGTLSMYRRPSELKTFEQICQVV